VASLRVCRQSHGKLSRAASCRLIIADRQKRWPGERSMLREVCLWGSVAVTTEYAFQGLGLPAESEAGDHRRRLDPSHIHRHRR